MLEYLEKSEALIFIHFDKSGNIKKTNPYAKATLFPDNDIAHMDELFLRFEQSVSILDLISENPLAIPLTVDSGHSLPDSYIFDFFKSGEDIFAFGRRDDREFSFLKEEIIFNNNELLNLNRQLQKQKEEVKRINRELKIAKDKADEASLAKSRFLASMSHEIRTPLHGIIGIIQLLNNDSIEVEMKEMLSFLGSSSHALLSLINDILDFSKIEAGKIILEEEEFSLEEIASHAIKNFYVAALGKKIGLRYEKVGGLPLLVKGDAKKINQILFNLISNAIKFTDHGEVTLHICQKELMNTSAGGSQRALIQLSVSDSGIGIHPNHLSSLFDPYFQVTEASKRNLGGTGLGLAITKQLCALMGGSISVESTLGKGTTFNCLIPFKISHSLIATEKTTLKELKPSRKIRILVAEDDIISQKILSKFVRSRGHECHITNNGEEFIEKFLENPKSYDLIIVDSQMPLKNGLESITELRQIQKSKGLKKIPVIALSADSQQESMERFLLAGANTYLVKPLKFDYFLRLVEDLVE